MQALGRLGERLEVTLDGARLGRAAARPRRGGVRRGRGERRDGRRTGLLLPRRHVLHRRLVGLAGLLGRRLALGLALRGLGGPEELGERALTHGGALSRH